MAYENTKALRSLLVLLLSTFLIGCAGKTAEPVKVIQLNDRELSCGQILSQMNQLDQEGRVLLPEILRSSSAFSSDALFIGMGRKFRIWEPEAFKGYERKARDHMKKRKKL